MEEYPIGVVFPLIFILEILVFIRSFWYRYVIDDYQKPEQHRKLGRYYHCKLDRVKTMLYHATTCCLIFYAFGRNSISLLASLLFFSSPTNNQCSLWMAGQRYGINTIYALLIWIFAPWGILIYMFAPIVLPSLFIAPLIFLASEQKYLALVIFSYFFIRKKAGMKEYRDRAVNMPKGELVRIRPLKIVLFFKAFGYYFWHCVFPRKLSFFHTFLESYGFSYEDNKYWYSFNWHFWMGITTTTGVVALIITYWSTPIGFGLFWWSLFIIQWCHFPYTLQQALSDRYCYLPNAGLYYAMAYALMLIPDPIIRYVIIGAVITYYLTRLSLLMPMYKNQRVFYHHILFYFPDQFRARSYLAHLYEKNGMWFHGICQCADGLRHRPRDCIFHILIAKGLIAIQQCEAAEKHLTDAENNLILGREEELKRTIEKLRDAIKKTNEGKVVSAKVIY